MSEQPEKPKPDIKAELRALKRFVKALEQMDDNGKRATIRWLVEKYADSTYGLYER